MNLGLALWVSVINSWAWNLVGPLSTTYAAQMRLSSTEASVLVATPILVGSLGRLVTGPLTDRFGGRILFIAVCVASILPVLAVGRRDRTLLSVAARVRLLSGCSRHGLRGRDPVCKQLVRTGPAWLCDGRVRHGHGRHRFVGVFHPAVCAVVRPVPHARGHRGGLGSDRGGVRRRDARRAGLHAEPSAGAAEAEGRRTIAGQLGDVVPVRHRLRRVCRVQQLSADLHQDDLRLLTRRRRRPHRRVRARRGAGPAGRRSARRPHRAEVRGAGLVGRHRGASVHRGVPATAGRALRRDVHHARGVPRHRHGRGVRLGGPPRAGRIGGCRHRNRRRRRWFGRLLPAAGDGCDLRLGHNNYTIGLLLRVLTALVALAYTALRLHAREPAPGRTAAPA